MIFDTLTQFLSRVDAAAEARGQSYLKPVILTFKTSQTSYEPIQVVVSDDEPYDVTSPLNVLWRVSKASSPDFGKLMRRSSRSAGGIYQHSWYEETNLVRVFDEQYWDLPEPDNQDLYDHATLVGNAHGTLPGDIGALDKSGDTMEGPLRTRILEEGESYGNDEAVPGSWVRSLFNPIAQLAVSLNQRFNNFNSQLTNLRSRTTTLEQTSSSKGYAHAQTEPAEIWVIPHSLNSTDLQIQVTEGDEIVWPSRTEFVDADNLKLHFAIPVIGNARVLPIT
tara:strand:+ start:55413 stop:56249 length:837 start_codon:yes stop_codon:yes gene_type:complete